MSNVPTLPAPPDDDTAPAEAEAPPPPPRKPRGFALLPPERRREISAAGGRKAHAEGTAHRYTTETAAIAGAKGGKAPHRSRGPARRTGTA